jgi:hypothetical protein
MAILGEVQNVFPEGFTWLTATLQVLGVVGLCIRALKIVGEDLIEILTTIDHVSR